MEELASHIERAENVTIRQMENFRVMYNSQRSRWIMAKQKEQGEAAQVPKEFRRSFCLSDGRFTAERFCDVLCEDLIFLQKEFLPEEEGISTADLLRRARSYLEENYSGEISMEDLSRRLGISQSYLSRSFKNEPHRLSDAVQDRGGMQDAGGRNAHRRYRFRGRTAGSEIFQPGL